MSFPLLNIGALGLNNSIRGAEKAATEIASSTIGADESSSRSPEGRAAIPSNEGEAVSKDAFNTLAAAVVDLKIYEVSAKANAKALETADEVIGTLLDTKV